MEHNMLGVAIFCGLYYAFAGWRPLYLTHSIWLFPLTSALPIGLLMGDVKGAMIPVSYTHLTLPTTPYV